MMPELLTLAQTSVPLGQLSAEFTTLEHCETIVGQMNVVPLLTELTMGAFKPPVSGTELKISRLQREIQSQLLRPDP